MRLIERLALVLSLFIVLAPVALLASLPLASDLGREPADILTLGLIYPFSYLPILAVVVVMLLLYQFLLKRTRPRLRAFGLGFLMIYLVGQAVALALVLILPDEVFSTAFTGPTSYYTNRMQTIATVVAVTGWLSFLSIVAFLGICIAAFITNRRGRNTAS